MERWLRELRDHADANIVIMLVSGDVNIAGSKTPHVVGRKFLSGV